MNQDKLTNLIYEHTNDLCLAQYLSRTILGAEREMSIFTDERGFISKLQGIQIPTYLLFTKKGYARGGCIHKDDDEWLVVLSGRIFFSNGDVHAYLTPGMVIKTPKGKAHYLLAKSDSYVLEWGASFDKEIKDHKMRSMVEYVNKAKNLKDEK